MIDEKRRICWPILVRIAAVPYKMAHWPFAGSGPNERADGVVLSSDMLEEAVPGNIRKAEHFIAFLKRFIEYLKVSLRHPRATESAD
jgi:hypothetical protein